MRYLSAPRARKQRDEHERNTIRRAHRVETPSKRSQSVVVNKSLRIRTEMLKVNGNSPLPSRSFAGYDHEQILRKGRGEISDQIKKKNLGDFLISDFYPSKFLKALFSHLPIFNDFYPWRSKGGAKLSLQNRFYTPIFFIITLF